MTLTAQTGPIDVAGYEVETENYNLAYLSPVIEAKPGDNVAAHIENRLRPRPHDMPHGDGDQNPTNLHYFHGGIVSPLNARPGDAELGTGDNVYVHLKAGSDFDLNVHIPGEGELDGRILEAKAGFIAHPAGLDWYHSHEHGISSDQVMGGMSGLLSVGESMANLKAKCPPKVSPQASCDDQTQALKQSTQVHYLLLRDLPLMNIAAPPEVAQNSAAVWNPSARDFSDADHCGIYGQDGVTLDETPEHRLGYCQVQRLGPKSAWLFTVNGQRYPTIKVGSAKSALLRMGNVSSNVAYWLELRSEDGKTTLPLTVVSRDGVVPASPTDPGDSVKPVDAKNVNDLLLMPAGRAEIYVRNDQAAHDDEQTWILRTKGLDTHGEPGKSDFWPAVQLAKIVLEPNRVQSRIGLALNAPRATRRESIAAATTVSPHAAAAKDGCVRDIDPDPKSLEYRRVTFIDRDPDETGIHPRWAIRTEIIHPDPGQDQNPKSEFSLKAADGTTLGQTNGVPFEDYLVNEHVDWAIPHVCIKLDHKGSHKQLWTLYNSTGTVHNFHIHQMKFRLATKGEILKHGIKAPSSSVVRPGGDSDFQYEIYDDESQIVNDQVQNPDWHDTIPIPPGTRVYIVMSFDASQQIGRFVFHCHILKHEDNGLMAPIEVWDPDAPT